MQKRKEKKNGRKGCRVHAWYQLYLMTKDRFWNRKWMMFICFRVYTRLISLIYYNPSLSEGGVIVAIHQDGLFSHSPPCPLFISPLT
jgi:hypothetical protein